MISVSHSQFFSCPVKVSTLEIEIMKKLFFINFFFIALENVQSLSFFPNLEQDCIPIVLNPNWESVKEISDNYKSGILVGNEFPENAFNKVLEIRNFWNFCPVLHADDKKTNLEKNEFLPVTKVAGYRLINLLLLLLLTTNSFLCLPHWFFNAYLSDF